MPWSWPGLVLPTAVASGNLVFTEPANSEEGDLFVVGISYRSTAAFTLPSGWSLVDVQLSGGNTTVNTTASIVSGLMAYIVRGSAAPALTFTRTAGDLAIGTLLSYRGGKIVGVYDTGRAELIAAQTTSMTLPSITTANAEELLVAMAALARSTTASAFDAVTAPTVASGATDTTTPPTANTWLERNDRGSTTGADGAIAVADAIKTAAGATGQLSYTAALGARHAMIVGAFNKETAYPEYRSSSTVQTTATTPNGVITPAMPSGWQPGDIFCMVIAFSQGGFRGSPNNTSGWTEVGAGSGVAIGTTGSASCFTRTALVGDTASNLAALIPSLTGGVEAMMIVHCFSNTSGVEGANELADDSSDTTGTGRSVVVSGPNRLVVNIGCVANNMSLNTGAYDLLSDVVAQDSIVTAARPKATAATVTGATFTNAVAGISAAFGFALKPLVSPPPFIGNRSMQHMLVR